MTMGTATKRISHWIGGRTAASQPGRSGVVWNPATGEPQASVDFAGAEEVDQAIEAAKAAFPGWRSTPLSRRAEIMFQVRESIAANRRKLAEIITSNTARRCLMPWARWRADWSAWNLPAAFRTFSRAATPNRPAGASTSTRFASRWGSWRESLPSTFPPWCRCGCSPTLSPAATRSSSSRRRENPAASVFLAGLLHQAGIPEGVFNVVHGDKAAVERLLEHPDIKAISFVGSTPVARYIYETAARNGKRVQALGGAKNHMLVLPDADHRLAADAAVSAGYGAAGERCMAVAVVLAVGAVADPLIEAIRQRMGRIRVGPGWKPATKWGR